MNTTALIQQLRAALCTAHALLFGSRPHGQADIDMLRAASRQGITAADQWIADQPAQKPDGCICEKEEQMWKPIETAPHDKRVMVWSGQEMHCAHWAQNPMTGDEAWIVAEWGDEGDQALVRPTHWRPLPLPPNAEVTGA